MKVSRNFRKILGKLSGLALATLFVVSCTNDYFMDETNLRLRVPQMADNSIENFSVTFHDMNGNHVRTEVFEAPFQSKYIDKTTGDIKFKIPAARYHISCFANYSSHLEETKGAPLAQSYKGNKMDAQTNSTTPLPTQPLAIFSVIEALPYSIPIGKDPFILNMDSTTRFKGRVITKFIDMPSVIDRIDIKYRGAATKLNYTGLFDNYHANEFIYATHDKLILQSTKQALSNTQVSDYILPSSKLTWDETELTRGRSTGTGTPISIDITFFQGKDVIGSTSISDADIPNLTKIPVDQNGQPMSSLILGSQQTLIFTIKGFTVIGIELEEWGDIVPGVVDPV